MSFARWDEAVSYPPIICLVDTTLMCTKVYLDGEYQRQTDIWNAHPVWLKSGFEGLFKSVYMFLYIDTNVNGLSTWRWVIGKDYQDSSFIIDYCGLHGFLVGKQ
eukprot:59879_1